MTRNRTTDAIGENDATTLATDLAVRDGTMVNKTMNADTSEDAQIHAMSRPTRDTTAMNQTVIDDGTRAAVPIPTSAGAMIRTKSIERKRRDETAEIDVLVKALAETLLAGDTMTTFHVGRAQRRGITGTDDGTTATMGPLTTTGLHQTRGMRKKGQENWQPCRMMLQTWIKPGRPASALWQRMNKRRAKLTIKRGPSHPSMAAEISPTDCTTRQETRASRTGSVAVGRAFKETTTDVVRSQHQLKRTRPRLTHVLKPCLQTAYSWNISPLQ